MVKVLVTGADGFAGSFLVENLLANDYNVRALVRNTPILNIPSRRVRKSMGKLKRLEIVKGDVMDYPSIQKALMHVDQVYHLASMSGIEETRRNPQGAWSDTTGTFNVINACIENRIQRMMYCSTCHVYGPQSTFPITESNIPQPNDIYSASKYSCETLSRALMNMNPDLDIVFSRAFNHYGPRQRENWLVPKIIMQALRDGSVHLGGNTSRDFSYVTDIVDGYRLIMEKGKRGEIYQLCSGIERTVEEIAEDVISVIGRRDIAVSFAVPRSADIPRSYGDAGKAIRELGWERRVPWTEGLRRTVKWYQERP